MFSVRSIFLLVEPPTQEMIWLDEQPILPLQALPLQWLYRCTYKDKPKPATSLQSLPADQECSIFKWIMKMPTYGKRKMYKISWFSKLTVKVSVES